MSFPILATSSCPGTFPEWLVGTYIRQVYDLLSVVALNLNFLQGFKVKLSDFT